MTSRVHDPNDDQPEYVRGPLGIWVPKSLRTNESTSAFDAMEGAIAVTVGWSDISGVKPTLAEVVNRLKRYQLVHLLAELSRLIVALERSGPDLFAQQETILAGLIGPEHTAKLRLLIARKAGDRDFPRDRTVFVHERQLLTAMKLALLEITITDSQDESDLVPLLESLLMLNDLLEADVEAADETTEQGRKILATWEVATSLYHGAGAAGPQAHARTLHFYIDPPDAASGAGEFEIAEGIQRATGLTPLDLYCAILAVKTFWLSLTEEAIADGRVVHRRGEWLSSLRHLDEDARRLWYATAVADLPELQRRVRARYGTNLHHFDFLEFEVTPLVSIDDNRVICLSTRFLAQLGTTGIYHRLLNSKFFSASERQSFLRAHGRITELYVTNALNRMFGARLLPEAKLRPIAERHGAKVCDAVVDYGDALVLYEIKGTRVPLAARQATSYESFLDAWRKSIERATAQLLAFAELVRTDKLAPIGLNARRIKRIYPVLVLYDHVALPQTYRRIQEDLLSRLPFGKAVREGRVQQLALMNVSDVELLEAAVEQGLNVCDALQTASDATPGIVLPMDLYFRLPETPPYPRVSSWHQREFDRLSRMARSRMKSLGMPQS